MPNFWTIITVVCVALLVYYLPVVFPWERKDRNDR